MVNKHRSTCKRNRLGVLLPGVPGSPGATSYQHSAGASATTRFTERYYVFTTCYYCLLLVLSLVNYLFVLRATAFHDSIVLLVNTCFDEVLESSINLEKVREGWRRSEKVGEGRRR